MQSGMIHSNTPRKKRKLYYDFFPSSLSSLPSPICSPDKANIKSKPVFPQPEELKNKEDFSTNKEVIINERWHSTAQKTKKRKCVQKSKKISPQLSKDRPWKAVSTLQLLMSDKDRLENGDLLDDKIIDAAQIMLREESVMGGLESVSFGQTLTFSVQKGEFVQIVHNGAGHWLTLSTVGTQQSTVHIYDSVYCSATDEVKNQLASILQTTSNKITLHFISVPRQSGSADCGVYAIAYATALVLGVRPEMYSFDQPRMRQHLLQCIESGKMTMFPTKSQRRVKKMIKATEKIKVYCFCRLPELNKTMIDCCACNLWYHLSCVTVPTNALNEDTTWYCSLCK